MYVVIANSLVVQYMYIIIMFALYKSLTLLRDLPSVSLVRKRGTEADSLTMTVFFTRWLPTLPGTHTTGESSISEAFELKV